MKTRRSGSKNQIDFREFMEYNDFTLVLTEGMTGDKQPYACAHIESCDGIPAMKHTNNCNKQSKVVAAMIRENPTLVRAVAALVEYISGKVIFFVEGEYVAVPRLEPWHSPLTASELKLE